MMTTASDERTDLKRGWTTGACATAAAKAAYTALVTGAFPDPVAIRLPGGEEPAFALAYESLGEGFARAGIIKDAGDDPDVTHGALIIASVRAAAPGTGVTFLAGPGVGVATKPGLPVAPGEPAINPMPRKMMHEAIAAVAARHGVPGDVEIEISVPDGEAIAQKTWNPRLGIVGGISILGTTGIVRPFSCSAWIHAIQSGIDVARAAGLDHLAGATGATSEAAVKTLYGLPDEALIDMGDFVGGMLKYVRRHPVARVTVAGGFGKMCKLAQGLLDLHSRRGEVDFAWLAARAEEAGGTPALIDGLAHANTASEALARAGDGGFDIGAVVAARARETALAALKDAPVALDTLVIDRKGVTVGRAG